jgi:hypothetical protein
VGAAILCSFGLLLAGCFSDSASDGEDNIGPTDPTSGNGAPTTPAATGFRALFAPQNGILPFPTDLYFNGTADGTVNLPAAAANPTWDAVNKLDGFSTIAPITAKFSAALNTNSFPPGSLAVVEVDVDPATKATVGVRRVLTPGQDYSVGLAPNLDDGDALLQITPLIPLRPNNVPATTPTARDVGYLVILTNGIRSAAGDVAAPDTTYQNFKAALPTCAAITGTLNGVCRLVGAHIQIATNPALAPAFGGTPLTPDRIVLTYSFSTQSIATTMARLAGAATARPTVVLPVPIITTGAALGPNSPNLANIHAGIITVPYYLSAPSAQDPTAPLIRNWRAAAAPPAPLADPNNERNLTRFNPDPAVTTDLTIPMLISVPRVGMKPATGWPVVIYQHGITEDRATMLLMADRLAGAGLAMVAIDLPLHGITPTDPFAALRAAGLPPPFNAREPTFDVDYINNATRAPGPDGQVDTSGIHFINLQSLVTSRDNVRQAIVNLINLGRSVPSMDLDGNPATVDFDGANMNFFGWSLGGIIGSAYLGTPANPVRAASLFAAGCGLLETLRQSGAFSPILNGGLAAAGIPTGSSLYWEFLRNAQTVTDSGDGCNYATAAAASHPIHMMEVVGTPGDATRPPDGVVPNTSTERLARLLGISPVTITTVNPAGVSGLVRFNQGDHGSIALPNASVAAWNEAQTELAVFMQSNGTTILISDPGVIAP